MKNGTRPQRSRHQLALAGVAAGADDGLYGGGRDVVVPRRQDEVIDLGGVEGLGDLLLIGLSVIAAAHLAVFEDYRTKLTSADFEVKLCAAAEEYDARRIGIICIAWTDVFDRINVDEVVLIGDKLCHVQESSRNSLTLRRTA